MAGSASAQGTPASTVLDLSNYGVRIEPDKRLIVVLATLDAALVPGDAAKGERAFKAALTPAGEAFRRRLESELTVPDDLRQKISTFVAQYRKRRPGLSDAETIAPFVSMAYSLSPAPELADPVVTSDLPGELLDVLDFAPLVREFYRRTGIGAKIDGYAAEYLKTADASLRGSAREMVTELLGYLHTRPQTIYTERVKVETQRSKRTVLNKTETREHERRFFIVPEMLMPAGNTTFLNIRDDYYVIVPPGTDLSISEARRAFLQYVADAVVFSNAKEIASVSAGIRQLLDERRKAGASVSTDVYLAVSRSLVAAVDARQSEYSQIQAATAAARQKIATLKTDAEKRAVTAELEKLKQTLADETALHLSEDYEKGAVLAFYFARQLRGLEDSGFDIAASMREMVLSLDAAKETDRLAEFADARKRGLAAREERRKRIAAAGAQAETAVIENPVTSRLLEIQKTIEAKSYAQARKDLKDLLGSNPGDARIYYNIGRVATLSAGATDDAEEQAGYLVEAKNAYSMVLKTAAPSTDKALISLTYVALARIYEFYNDRAMAMQLYDKAIQLADVPGGAYAQAIAGKQQLLKTP